MRLLLILFLTLLAQRSPAATFSVTNTGDSGAGSLRQGVSDSNALGGTNTIAWGVGSGGTLTLLSDLPGVAAMTTLDVSNAPSAVTIAGSPNAIPLAGAATFNNTSVPQVWTISAVISGAGSLTKTGAGTLTLTGANTYTGGTTLAGGTLNINADAALGGLAGGVAFNGGTLQTAAGIATARAFTMTSAGTFDTQGFNSSISGVIGGGGALTVLGAGTLTLTGINTFTGGLTFNAGTINVNNNSALGAGTLVFNGGTLQTAAAVSVTSISLNALGGTIDTLGNSLALSGNISGAGALNILNDVGATKLTLTGSNSYGGGTVFNAGTLNINMNSSLGSGAITFNGGVLQTASTVTVSNAVTLTGNGTIDTLGNLSSFSGIISGAGTLTSASTGTLALTGINAYTGGTVLSSGTLSINNKAALGTGTLTYNGGILQMVNSFSLTNAMTLTKTATIDTNGNNTALSGAITGAGGLTKLGKGILTLAQAMGVNTYGGATIVNGGTLALGASGALPAATALTVAAGSFFDAQAFTQTVASYDGSGGGTLKMVLKPAVTNLTITGAANMTNGTLSVALPQGAVVKAGDVFVPIAIGGAITGTVPKILSPAALSFTPTYAGGGITLTTVLVPFSAVAATGNQATIGAALEPLRVSPAGDSAAVLSQLYAMDTGSLRAALDQIGPASLASMAGIGLAGASVQAAAVSQRMAVLADGNDHPGFSTYGLARRSPYPGALYAAAGAGDDETPASAPDDKGASSPWGFFGSGAATGGRLSEANSVNGTQPGYAFNSGGFTGGADYRLGDQIAVGGSAGYLHGHASIYSPGAGTVDDNSARLGAYATAGGEKLHSTFYLGGALDSFSTKRAIAIGTLRRTASASPRGTELNMNGSLSYDLRSLEWGIFSPFAGLNYNRLMIGAFSEDGAGSLNLSVGAQTAESLQSSLGLRYSWQFDVDSRSVVPYGSLGWRHEFEGQSRPISAQFADGGGNPFSVTTGSYARDGTILGTGVSVSLGKGAVAKFDYAGDFRSRFQDSMFNASVRLRF
ncbi:MAG: autotransporter domain-containing protein [Elusimicrobia bacterium]|nr:autotransporter domain-containing protein [Elusimicrobiota bacterium]